MPKGLDIVKYPDPILLEKAESVTEADTPEIRTLVMNMMETVKHLQGLGLAAPQVGVSKRIIIFKNADGNLVELINPVMVWMDGETWQQESCFSVPGFSGVARRYAKVRVTGVDMHGFIREYETAADGVNPDSLQHEMDHLDGTLFVERLNRQSRRAWERFCRKRRW